MMATARRRVILNKIFTNGELEEDEGAIAAHIEEFYTNLYKETNSWRPRLEEVGMDKITMEKKVGAGKKNA